MIDSRDIGDLHPTLQKGCTELKAKLKALGYDMGISSTYRDNERQNALYEQGRSKPGNIVTNARAGQSMHNYKLAFDIFQNAKGKEYETSFLNSAGKIGQDMGFVWGGSWVGFVDKPHFEFSNGISLGQLQKGLYLPDDIKMRWEIKMREDIEKLAKENLKYDVQIKGLIMEIEALKSKMYKIADDVPSWGKPTIDKLLQKNIIVGIDAENLNISDEMLRVLVINDRAKMYDD